MSVDGHRGRSPPASKAPLGVALSAARRHALLRWAARSASWIIEDDYLSELQLRGRAAPALMAADHAGRVIYLGTFSKTLGPSIWYATDAARAPGLLLGVTNLVEPDVACDQLKALIAPLQRRRKRSP